jgi:hypothetical protein
VKCKAKKPRDEKIYVAERRPEEGDLDFFRNIRLDRGLFL